MALLDEQFRNRLYGYFDQLGVEYIKFDIHKLFDSMTEEEYLVFMNIFNRYFEEEEEE